MNENMHELQQKQQSNSFKKWPVLVTKATAHYNKTEEHDVYVKIRTPALHHDSPGEDSAPWQKPEGNVATAGHAYRSLPCWCNRKTDCCHEVTSNKKKQTMCRNSTLDLLSELLSQKVTPK